MSTRVQGSGVRAGCEGVVALDGRLEPWQQRLCRRPELLRAWLDEHGSPVNVLDPAPLARNAAALADAAAAAGLDLGIYFARKANKALAFVDAAHALGLGVDLASERELAQVLDRGVPGSALVMTAAVKPAALLGPLRRLRHDRRGRQRRRAARARGHGTRRAEVRHGSARGRGLLGHGRARGRGLRGQGRAAPRPSSRTTVPRPGSASSSTRRSRSPATAGRRN